MLGDKPTVCERNDDVAELTLLIRGLRCDEEHLLVHTLGKVSRQDGVGTLDLLANVDLHTDHTVGVEHTNVAVRTVMRREGSRGDEYLIPNLGRGDLYASLDRGVKSQELGSTGVLVVIHTDGSEVIRMLSFSHDQGGGGLQAVALTHLRVVDGGLDAQVQVGSGIVDGIVLVVGHAVGQINERVDDIHLGRIGHVEVHGLVGIQILVGMQGLFSLIEQHQLMIVDGHAHIQGGGDLLGSGRGQATVAHLGAQLGGIQGQGPVLTTGFDDIGASVLQLSVGIIFRAVQSEREGLTAAQHFFDAGARRVLRKVGQIRGREFDHGDSSSRSKRRSGHSGNGLGLFHDEFPFLQKRLSCYTKSGC